LAIQPVISRTESFAALYESTNVWALVKVQRSYSRFQCGPSPGHAGSDYNVGFVELKTRSRFKLGKDDLQRKGSLIALELEVLRRN